MKTNFYLFFTFVFLMINTHLKAQQPCTIVCYDSRVIAASPTCATLVTSDMTIVEVTGSCGTLTTTILSGIDTVINPIPGMFNGIPLEAVVTSSTSGNVCVTDIFLRDFDPPVLTRSESYISIDCNMTIDDLAPIVDECSEYVLDVIIEEYCDPINGLVREYTWVAEDVAGNTDQLIVEYEMAFDPNNILFPPDFTISCDDPLAVGCGGAPCTEVSGIPLISPSNCIDVTTSFSDYAVVICPGYTKILRTWSIYNACELILEHIQVIKLLDLNGPVITPPTLPPVIPFDTWKNEAIPMATATDVCGAVDFIDYEDIYDPTCDVLNITRIWTAYDVCGNFTTASVNFQVQYQFDCQIPKIPKTTCGDPVVIEVNVIGGVPPYTYQWTNTGNWVIVSSSTQNPIDVVSGSGQATFTAVITDAIGCETECTRKVKCKKAKKPKKRITIESVYSIGESITIHWNAEVESVANIQVWNTMGQKVAEKGEMTYPGENNTKLQLADYIPGLYLVSIETADSRVVRKVMVY